MVLKRIHLGRVSYSFDTFNEIKEQIIQYYALNKGILYLSLIKLILSLINY